MIYASRTAIALVLLSCYSIRALPTRRVPPFLEAFRYAGSQPSYHKLLSEDLINQCTKKYLKVPLDHFAWIADQSSIDLRYYVCDRFWMPGGPIFFYLGNEADVTIYLRATGLMWQLGRSKNAMLIFAEHRYYGESKPLHLTAVDTQNPNDHINPLAYLTSEQAMADYAKLIWHLRENYHDDNLPVIGFGGSYGGMLAAWFRLKYPHLMDGAIAASAPIWTYLHEDPPYDQGSFAAIVTDDASYEIGGASPQCIPNTRNAWKLLFDLSTTPHGRQFITNIMRICPDTLRSDKDVATLAEWCQNAFDYLSMGNYPYESDYMLGGYGLLPAYPMRVACDHLSLPAMTGADLLNGLADAVGVFYNYSQELPCYDIGTASDEISMDAIKRSNKNTSNNNDDDSNLWGYQYCTEQFQPFSRDGIRDMFWKQEFDPIKTSDECYKQWGVRPRPTKPSIEWGGKRLASLSNVVFSNGRMDPWMGGGVLHNLSDTVVAVIIPEGAHHLDLMFDHENDPESVRQARQLEEEHISMWIEQARERGRMHVSEAKRQGGNGDGMLAVISGEKKKSL